MTKFKVHVTRLVEQECRFYVEALDAKQAADLAIEEACEVPTMIWDFSDAEPHSIAVEACELSELVDRKGAA